MLGIAAVLFAGVVWRYAFGDPLGWSDEVARILFVWLAFIGAAVGVKRRLHASVAILSSRLPPRWQLAAAILSALLMLILAVVFVDVGAREAFDSFGQESMPVSGLPTGWLYLAVPVSGALMIGYLVPQLWSLVVKQQMPALPASHNSAE